MQKISHFNYIFFVYAQVFSLIFYDNFLFCFVDIFFDSISEEWRYHTTYKTNSNVY